jgi:hypothetical protein
MSGTLSTWMVVACTWLRWQMARMASQAASASEPERRLTCIMATVEEGEGLQTCRWCTSRRAGRARRARRSEDTSTWEGACKRGGKEG